MNSGMPPAPEELPDQPIPFDPARGHGLVAERLVSVNGLISLVLLSGSAMALWGPAKSRALLDGIWRRCPWLVRAQPPR